MTITHVEALVWLTAFPQLRDLDDATSRHLIRVARMTEVAQGTSLFREAEPCRRYFFVVRGRLRVYKTMTTGREIVLYRTERGGTCLLTTAILLSGGRYPASAVTEAQTLLVQLPPADFHTVFDRSRVFRDFVCSTFTRPVEGLISLMEGIMLRNVDMRLAEWILRNGMRGSPVEISHRALAFEVGTAREVVSRRLKEFERNGWILLTRKRIQVVDRESLSDIATASPRHARR